MGRYRKKLVVIDAFQMTRERREDNSDWPAWMHQAWNATWPEPGALSCSDYPNSNGKDQLVISTLEGPLTVAWDDWIIRGVKGELYPCKPDIFDATYEPADSETSIAANSLPSTAMRAVDEEDKTLERAAHVGDEQQHNLGKFAGEQPYRKPRDKRVQKLLTEAQRSRDAEAEREDEPPRKIYTDPRIKAPEWKPPKEADKSE